MARQITIGVVLLLVAAVSAVSAGAARGTHVFRGADIFVRYPDGWYVTNEPLNGITDPVQRFVLSSYRVPIGADAGGSYVPSSHGVIAQLLEEEPPIANKGPWQPRPHRFRLSG